MANSPSWYLARTLQQNFFRPISSGMFHMPQGRHSDSDTVSTSSVSDSSPGMFNVPQAWHSDSDTVTSRSVSPYP